MATYSSDGKKLLNVEYDVTPEINDVVDGMRVISKDENEEDIIPLLMNNISCYIFDETYIIGNVSGFENLPEAIKAWKNNEI